MSPAFPTNSVGPSLYNDYEELENHQEGNERLKI